MEILPDIEEAARYLGQALHDDPATRADLQARQRVEADPEAGVLERELYASCEALLARQQAGEQIAREELDAFHALRGRVVTHPLVAERENALQAVKGLFAAVAVEIGAPLGVDYTALVQR